MILFGVELLAKPSGTCRTGRISAKGFSYSAMCEAFAAYITQCMGGRDGAKFPVPDLESCWQNLESTCRTGSVFAKGFSRLMMCEIFSRSHNVYGSLLAVANRMGGIMHERDGAELHLAQPREVASAIPREWFAKP